MGLFPIEPFLEFSADIWLLFALLSTILSLILLIVFCAVYNRIRLAAAVVAESSRCIGGSMGALAWPIFPFALQLGAHCLFIVGFIYFATATSDGSQTIDYNAIQKNIV